MKLTYCCSSAFAQSENNVDPHDSAEQVAQPVVQEQVNFCCISCTMQKREINNSPFVQMVADVPQPAEINQQFGIFCFHASLSRVR